MSSAIQKAWKMKRDRAIKRFVAAWNKYDSDRGDDPEDVNAALDALTVAHMAAALEWDGKTAKDSDEVEVMAMERLAAVWEKYEEAGENDPLLEEELNIALDALSVIHAAATFEWATGPLKW